MDWFLYDNSLRYEKVNSKSKKNYSFYHAVQT